MESFPNNAFEVVEEPVAPQIPDAIMEVMETAPLSQREMLSREADGDTAAFIRNITEPSPVR